MSRRRQSLTTENSDRLLVPPPDRFLDDVFGEDDDDADDDDRELKELERRLNEEVEEDFFQEPKRFNTLHRVIDVLGLQMLDEAGPDDGGNLNFSNIKNRRVNVDTNPAYRNLKAQQQIVEGAIEHMAVIHCADLNGSVIQVGRVSRQFRDAVAKVRDLRRQVAEIQGTLGAANHNNNANNNATSSNGNNAPNTPGVNTTTTTSAATSSGSMSLRELWLKKLECEAVLALLDRLDVIRAAPSEFDVLVRHSRIGAGVLTISRALATMFSDDIAQVQALHKIMEQLLLRKQKAEEMVWETLADVVFLRTGNGLQQTNPQSGAIKQQNHKQFSSSASVSSQHSRKSSGLGSSRRYSSQQSRQSHQQQQRKRGKIIVLTGSSGSTTGSVIFNPFGNRYATDEDRLAQQQPQKSSTATDQNFNDTDSIQSQDSGASLFSLENQKLGEEDEERDHEDDLEEKLDEPKSPTARANRLRMMIPIPFLEAELDLENDERRGLEEVALSGITIKRRPKYADPVLALRILVECCRHLGRLDDVERVVADILPREIRVLVQRENAKTFRILQQKNATTTASSSTMMMRNRASMSLMEPSAATSSMWKAYNSSLISPEQQLQDFRRHLTGLLSAFGCVVLRLAHLAEVLRIRISSDRELLKKIESPSSVMRSVLVAATDLMQQEIKDFLKACLYENKDSTSASKKGGGGDFLDHLGGETKAYENDLFSLGIADTGPSRAGEQHSSGFGTSTSRSEAAEMSTSTFVSSFLFPKTKLSPHVRHALAFRRSVAQWQSQIEELHKELAMITNEDTSSPSFRAAITGSSEQNAISYLDQAIKNDLLPMLQEEAVNGTVKGLERRDAFDPVLGRGLYSQSNTQDPQDVEMCIACQGVYQSTGPLFVALHRLPPGGREMHLPLVAVLEHVMLTFISRVKQQVARICEKKTALKLLLLEGKDGVPSLSAIMERRHPFSLLALAYVDGDTMEGVITALDKRSKSRGIMPLTPPSTDTPGRRAVSLDLQHDPALEDIGEGVEGEENLMAMELAYMKEYFDFDTTGKTNKIVVCNDEELMRASCLSHSLLKLASLLENRLKVRNSSSSGSSYTKSLSSTRALREAINTIKTNGFRMAKFCRLDMLMQVITRLAKVCQSSTLVARDAVRIPSSVNDLGEYLTAASDNLREACGNAVTAYSFSSLEQYIPFCLMQAVRVIAVGHGIILKSPLTMNGIEALDRSGSVLYRDLKGATSFDNSSWDMELAAISFERSASFMAMMELEMEELVAYYTANSDEFSEEDFELMFSMNGPRRRGDVGRYHMTKKNLVKS